MKSGCAPGRGVRTLPSPFPTVSVLGSGGPQFDDTVEYVQARVRYLKGEEFGTQGDDST